MWGTTVQPVLHYVTEPKKVAGVTRRNAWGQTIVWHWLSLISIFYFSSFKVLNYDDPCLASLSEIWWQCNKSLKDNFFILESGKNQQSNS